MEVNKTQTDQIHYKGEVYLKKEDIIKLLANVLPSEVPTDKIKVYVNDNYHEIPVTVTWDYIEEVKS